MITVWLYGALADKFGKKYNLDVSSLAEAVMALEANNPGRFKKELVGNAYQISRGHDFETGEGVTEKTLELCRPGMDIHIVPVIEGGKKQGLFQTILGVVITAVAYYYGGPSSGSAAAKFWFGVGVSMAIGGAAQMLSPTPDISGIGGVSENIDPRKSFIFNGAKNVTEQGVPVYINYGEFEVGSVVVSQSLTAERI